MSRCPTSNRGTTSKFRIAAKHIFFTVPQTETTPTQGIQRIREKWEKELSYCLVAQEEHQDGNHHLHGILCFSEKKNFKNSAFLDFVARKHGNYQACRSLIKTIEYTKKKGVFEEWGKKPEKERERKKTSDLVAQSVVEGKSILQIMEDHPGFVLLHSKKIEELQVRLKNAPTTKDKWPGRVYAPVNCKATTQTVCGWLERNLLQERAFKSPQLYVQAPPNFRKTSLITTLARWVRVWIAPTQERFYDSYVDEDYDLAVFDEFGPSQHCVHFLNQFLEGTNMVIRKKGGQGIKKKNIPVIILSNYSVEDCFPKPLQAKSFQSRIEFVFLEEPLPLEKIEFLPCTAPNSPLDQESEQETQILGGGFIPEDSDHDKDPAEGEDPDFDDDHFSFFLPSDSDSDQ